MDMLSNRLRTFVAARCDVDSDIAEVARHLRNYPDGGWAWWLQDDLRAAIDGRDFTPKLVHSLTGIGFDTQAEVDDWLRDLWMTFFPGDLYPGDPGDLGGRAPAQDRPADAGTEPRNAAKTRPPENATRFTSDEALVAAIAIAWADPDAAHRRKEAEDRYTAALDADASTDELAKIARFTAVVSYTPVEQALGLDWRKHIQGFAKYTAEPTRFAADTEIKTIWKLTPPSDATWYVWTCYPASLTNRPVTTLASERLGEFMTVWCDADADTDDVADLLRTYPDYGFSLWLKDDLTQAIRHDEFTPDAVVRLTYVGVRDQADVDAWLRELWTTWFPGDPYPGDRT